VTDLFGFHALQLGLPDLAGLRANRMPHRWLASDAHPDPWPLGRDVILTNCYPYWEGCPIEYSLPHMQSMFNSAKDAGQGKRVIITETGWPSEGGSLKGAVATNENAMKYFIESQNWSKFNDIEIFYFSSFDESWKVGPEGAVGAYWGLWDKNEKLKF
jgi:exo-beta-1,3-glucanase (GH17 family)